MYSYLKQVWNCGCRCSTLQATRQFSGRQEDYRLWYPSPSGPRTAGMGSHLHPVSDPGTTLASFASFSTLRQSGACPACAAFILFCWPSYACPASAASIFPLRQSDPCPTCAASTSPLLAIRCLTCLCCLLCMHWGALRPASTHHAPYLDSLRFDPHTAPSLLPLMPSCFKSPFALGPYPGSLPQACVVLMPFRGYLAAGIWPIRYGLFSSSVPIPGPCP